MESPIWDRLIVIISYLSKRNLLRHRGKIRSLQCPLQFNTVVLREMCLYDPHVRFRVPIPRDLSRALTHHSPPKLKTSLKSDLYVSVVYVCVCHPHIWGYMCLCAQMQEPEGNIRCPGIPIVFPRDRNPTKNGVKLTASKSQQTSCLYSSQQYSYRHMRRPQPELEVLGFKLGFSCLYS